MTRLTLTVNGMDCPHCEDRISRMLSRLDGTSSVEADHRKGSVVVNYDPAAVSEERIIERLSTAGYVVTKTEPR